MDQGKTAKQEYDMRLLKNIYLYCNNKYWEKMSEKDPLLATQLLYKKRTGKDLNLDCPKSLTEKLQWLKLNKYWHNALVTQCIDKYAVRKVVTERGYANILNDLYAVWDSVDQIQWDILPAKFVLKCTHGCGFNIVCDDSSHFNRNMAMKSLRKWMNCSYGGANAELLYSDIKPKIICEKYIEADDGGALKDYKIFCSFGVPKLVYVITGGHGHNECLDYYTTEWKWIPVNNGTLPNAGDVVKKPNNLDALLETAAGLAKGFPIVRVDLYSVFGEIIFGELTFLPTGGFSRFNPSKYDYEFGDMFPLSI